MKNVFIMFSRNIPSVNTPIFRKKKRKAHHELAILSGREYDLAPEAEQKDYRDADLWGRRLFVTGLGPAVDDVKLFLGFARVGGLIEARVVKPGGPANLGYGYHYQFKF